MAQKLIIEVVGDSRSYERALGRSSKATKEFGRSIGVVGKTSVASLAKGALAATGVAVGITAAGRAITGSVKASTDFEQSLTKMIGLSGVAQGAISALRRDVLRLAPAVGRSPQELAEALFFITSSGIPAARALDVLTVSAKASAAGLGETQVVADAVTSALNAYGQENLSAAQATDVLVATVREGKGEAADFAGVIGNTVAIAGELGVSFDQVGAALAAMTRLGTDAETAAVQLQQVFSALLSNSPQVKEAFASVGLGLGDLIKQIATPGGFLPALQKIKAAFGTNTKAIRQAFPEIRAFRGVIALVGKQAAPVVGIFQRLAQSTGSLETAFGAVTTTQAQQFAKLQASIEVFRITLGSALAPAIMDVVKPLNEWLSVSENQEKVQKNIRDTVGGLVGAMKSVVAVIKPLFETTRNLVGAMGGLREVMKLLIPLFVASKIVGFASAMTGLNTALLVGTTRAKAFRLAMLRLGAIGVIALGITLFMEKDALNKAGRDVQNWINDKLPGKFFNNSLDIPIAFTVENIGALQLARENLAKIVGEDNLRVQALDKVIDRLIKIQRKSPVKVDVEVKTRFTSSGIDPADEFGRSRGTPGFNAGGEPTFKTPAQTASEGNAVIARITRQAAAATRSLNRQLADSETRAAHLRDLIRADPANVTLQKRLTAELQKQVGLREDIVESERQSAENARDAARAAKEARLETQRENEERRKAQEERRKSAVQRGLFKQLGLTAEGEKPTPGPGALIKRAQSMLDSLKGTSMDTKKNRSQLKTIVSVLKKNFKSAGKEVREAILQMLNDISGAADSAGKKGPITKTSGLSMKVLEGMGLSPEEERELRRRLSSVTGPIRQAGGGRQTREARGGANFGINDPIFVESHTYINLDGQLVATSVTKQQQKNRRRNPGQKRGPGARR